MLFTQYFDRDLGVGQLLIDVRKTSDIQTFYTNNIIKILTTHTQSYQSNDRTQKELLVNLLIHDKDVDITNIKITDDLQLPELNIFKDVFNIYNIEHDKDRIFYFMVSLFTQNSEVPYNFIEEYIAKLRNTGKLQRYLDNTWYNTLLLKLSSKRKLRFNNDIMVLLSYRFEYISEHIDDFLYALSLYYIHDIPFMDRVNYKSFNKQIPMIINESGLLYGDLILHKNIYEIIYNYAEQYASLYNGKKLSITNLYNYGINIHGKKRVHQELKKSISNFVVDNERRETFYKLMNNKVHDELIDFIINLGELLDDENTKHIIQHYIIDNTDYHEYLIYKEIEKVSSKDAQSYAYKFLSVKEYVDRLLRVCKIDVNKKRIYTSDITYLLPIFSYLLPENTVIDDTLVVYKSMGNIIGALGNNVSSWYEHHNIKVLLELYKTNVLKFINKKPSGVLHNINMKSFTIQMLFQISGPEKDEDLVNMQKEYNYVNNNLDLLKHILTFYIKTGKIPHDYISICKNKISQYGRYDITENTINAVIDSKDNITSIIDVLFNRLSLLTTMKDNLSGGNDYQYLHNDDNVKYLTFLELLIILSYIDDNLIPDKVIKAMDKFVCIEDTIMEGLTTGKYTIPANLPNSIFRNTSGHHNHINSLNLFNYKTLNKSSKLYTKIQSEMIKKQYKKI